MNALEEDDFGEFVVDFIHFDIFFAVADWEVLKLTR